MAPKWLNLWEHERPRQVQSRTISNYSPHSPIPEAFPSSQPFLMLPNELLDIIIEECRDDRETLMSCSLVNRALRWSSQKRLFATITLSGSHCYTTPYPFLLRLFSSSSQIASYVKSLRIHDSDKEIIPQILEQLPNIESLSIIRTPPSFIGSALKHALSRPQLQDVSFDGMTFETSEEFFELFALRREIHSLKFTDSRIETVLPSSMVPSRRCTIQDLSLQTGERETNESVDEMLRVSSTIDFGCLKRLQFWMTTAAYLPALQKLLVATKGTLEELHLHLLALGMMFRSDSSQMDDDKQLRQGRANWTSAVSHV